MAQGELLSVAVRLYEVTSNDKYLALATEIFNSLLRIQGFSDRWVSRVDSSGYFWLEEYPLENGPDQTLNGTVYAVYGVYDFWRITRRKEVKRVYDACLTSIKHYLPLYRRPGSLSYYCLGHHYEATLGYHNLHITMCKELHKITGDPFFSSMADSLVADTPDSLRSVARQ